ncbi:MAG: radical SAM protein [Candidatus Omnitrophota bacterium]
MKKILLIHPTFESSAQHTLVCRKGYGTAIPLGIAYVAANLIGKGHDVRIYDFQVEETDLWDVIEEFKPDVFGLSVMTPTANASAGLAAALKARYPGIPVIAGGPHPTILKGAIFSESPSYDYLVIGEGEVTCHELLDAMDGLRPLRDVKGLCFRSEGRVVETEPRPFLQDMDTLSRLPVELFHYERYMPTPGTFIYLPSLAFLSSRGCPFNCVFCNKNMFGNTLRYMSAARLVDEIAELKERFGFREINFYDDTFTVDNTRVSEICRLLISRKINIKWKCNSRVNTVTREMLFEMKQAGCFSISFGVESGDEEVLKKIRKGITLEQVRNAFRWSKEAGITRSAFFMLNLPGDTRASIEKTLQFSREIRPDFVSFELTKPLPGTAIAEALKNETHVHIREELWNDYNNCAVSNMVFFTQNDLTEEYLQDAFKRAVRGFYLNPVFIWGRLTALRSFGQFKSYARAFMNILTAKVGK